MVAKTEEDKAVEADQKLQADNAKAEKERADLAAASVTAAEAEAKATAELREEIRAEERAKLAEDVKDGGDSKTFSGQLVTSANFSVVTSEDLGRPELEIRPTGWVGPGFSVSPRRVKELTKLLQSIKNLPEQEKAE